MSVKSHPARDAARAAGHKTYVTGTKCSKGHLAPRLASNSNCTECDLASQYMRRTGKTRAEFEKMRAAKRNGTYARPSKPKSPKPKSPRTQVCRGVLDIAPGIRKLAAEKRESKLPMIGADADLSLTERKLIKANAKFLKLLYQQALLAAREAKAC